MMFFFGLVLAAATPASYEPTQTPYHVYEIHAPAQSQVFRVRLSDEATKLWAIEQIYGVSIYDNAGGQLGCIQESRSNLGWTKKSYPLVGVWRDLEKEPVQARGTYGALNFAWRFAMPNFAENEIPSYLHFKWRSKVDNPGEVRAVEVPANKNVNGPMGGHLMDGQSDHAQGHVNIPLQSDSSKVWAPEMDLLFSLSQDELRIESPVLETRTKKPWLLTGVPDPGWIIFKGDGKVPYRMQVGDVLNGCSGIDVDDQSASFSNPEWPPEIGSGVEIANAPRMGESQASWNKKLVERIGTKMRGNWLLWGIWIGLAFGAALLYVVLVSPKR